MVDFHIFIGYLYWREYNLYLYPRCPREVPLTVVSSIDPLALSIFIGKIVWISLKSENACAILEA